MSGQIKDSIVNLCSIGALLELQNAYLRYVETSAAIYESNGEYATELMVGSPYCRILVEASARMREEGGRDICHEDCRACALKAINAERPQKMECSGGIHLYAVPILCDGAAIGALSAGVSNPPEDKERLAKIADVYGIEFEALWRAACDFVRKPDYLYEGAKDHIRHTAKIIALLCEKELRAREARKVIEDRSNELNRSRLAYLNILEDMEEKKRLLQARTQELSALNAIAAAVSASLDLEEILNVALDTIQELTDFEVVGIGLWDESQQCLVPMAVRGAASPELLATFIATPRPGGLRELALSTREAVFIDESTYLSQVGPQVQAEGFTMAAIIPLVSQERVLGMLALGKRSARLWTADEKRLLKAIGSTISVGIENAQLYQAAQQELAERKRAEEEIRRLKEFNEGIVQNMAEGIAVEDAEGYFTFINPAAATLLGYTPEELLGQHWTAIIPPDQHPIVQAANERRARGETDRYELQLIRKDGTRVPVIVSSSPRFEEGRFAGTMAVFTDITERVRAERLLRGLNEAALAMERALTPEEIFTAVAGELKKLGFSCAVFLTDESQSRLFPKYLSYEASALKAAEKLTGLKAKDFSMPVKTVDVYKKVVWERKTVFVESAEEVIWQLLPEPANRFAGQIARMLKLPKSIAAPLIVEDKVIGVLSVQSENLTEDDIPAITAFANQMAAAWRKAKLMQDLEKSLEELKLIQAQLIQAQKLESIGRLAGGIAHDFNNLLTTIRGYASLVLMDTPEDDPRRQDLQRIITAADRAAALTRQLALFSRREVPQRQPLQLNRIVRETYELLEETFPRTIKIELALEPEVWTIEADPSQMSQVLMNLCVNARDAMPEGGVLTLETRNVTLGEEYARTHIEAKPGHYVRLSVSDTGVGMSEEVQSHLFEPFFTTKEAGEGTGLGLSTVYGIVKAHNGFITVYSEVGRGSTFHIYLPAKEQGVETVVEEEGIELPRGTETVLLVDDEEAVRELGRSILERCGYNALVAQNGAEALEVYRERGGEIALVVLDMVMPEMDGRECLRRLLEMDPEARVLIATGYTVGSSARALVSEGALGVVEKPYRLHELAIAVREALDAGRKE